jgi:hypothetical protein
VADIPDRLVIVRDLELRGRLRHAWIRRAFLLAVAALPVVALANVFGQRPATSRAGSTDAVLSVYSPDRVRGGLLYTARFHVTARRDLRKALLVLDPGWVEGMQVNSVNPQPVDEGSRDGRIVLDLGHIAPAHDLPSG